MDPVMEVIMAVDRNDGLDDRSLSGSTGSGMGGSTGGGLGGSTTGGYGGSSYGTGGTTAGESAFDRDDGASSIRERGEEMLDEGRERISHAADQGRSRVAGKLEEFGDRLEERGREAQYRGGLQGRAGQAALRASGALDDSAEYLRSHDVDDMRDDLERQIRHRPLMSVGVALGAGFLLARILRD
jgi:ElaB/YqjD/DUF883 family membrane-anchored ribosome-binding protein